MPPIAPLHHRAASNDAEAQITTNAALAVGRPGSLESGLTQET